MSRVDRLIAAILLALACGACGQSHDRLTKQDRSVLAVDLALTRPAGEGPRFRPPATVGVGVSRGAPVGRFRCSRDDRVGYGVHIELFARGRGVVVPAGIGISTRRRCAYPLRTVEPTGVIQVGRATRGALTLGELFRLWGQPLSRSRLASFPGAVVAFVDGRRWSGDPRAIPLARHAQIVLEVGPRVAPHASYTFPPGL